MHRIWLITLYMSRLWSVQKSTFVPLKLNYLWRFSQIQLKKPNVVLLLTSVHKYSLKLVLQLQTQHWFIYGIIQLQFQLAYRRKRCPLTIFSDARTELRMCEKAVKGKVRQTFRKPRELFLKNISIYLTVAEAIVNKMLCYSRL